VKSRKSILIVALVVVLGLGGFFFAGRVFAYVTHSSGYNVWPMMYNNNDDDNNNDNTYGCVGGFNRMGVFRTVTNDVSSTDTLGYYMSVIPTTETVERFVNKTFDVAIWNSDDVLVYEDELTTNPSGSIGFWLPSGFTGTIEIVYGDLSGSQEVIIDEYDYPCIGNVELFVLQ